MSNSKRFGARTIKLAVLILLLLALFAMMTAGALYFLMEYRQGKVAGGQRETAAIQGSLKTMTQQEIQDELNRIVEEGMFRISIASAIVGEENGKMEMRIENNAANRYLMRVSIVLDETGEEVYTTDTIDPGYHIMEDALDKPLPAGQYPATAIFTALYPDTGAIVGTAGAQVTLYVLEPK